MAWIRTTSESEATAELALLYRRMADPATGRVDEVLKVHSLHVEGLEAHWAVYRAAMRGTETLPACEREMVAVVVSALNRCAY
jgi:alkylhydroperoxidase family enzyme